MDDPTRAADALLAGLRIALERGTAHPQRNEAAAVLLALLVVAAVGTAVRLRAGKR